MINLSRLAALTALLGLASPAQAQVDWSGIIYTEAVNSAVSETVRPPQPLSRRAIRQAAPREIPTATFRSAYAPSIQRRSANIRSFATKMRANGDPVGARKMLELTASKDIIGQIHSAMQSNVGLSAYDLADAYALWWVSAWKGTRLDPSTASRATYHAVRAQALSGLGKVDSVRNASDAEKQQLAEALLIQAALIDEVVGQTIESGASAAPVRRAIAEGARRAGLDLTTMTLTSSGFAPAVAARR